MELKDSGKLRGENYWVVVAALMLQYLVSTRG